MHQIYKRLLGKSVLLVGFTLGMFSMLSAQTVSITPSQSTVCTGSNGQFFMEVTGGTAPYTLNYNDGTNTFTAQTDNMGNYVHDQVISQPTTITVETITDADNVTVVSGESATITTQDPPTATLTPGSQTICQGQVPDIDLILTGTDGIIHEVRDQNGNILMSGNLPAGTYPFVPPAPSSTTTYLVTFVMDEFGCNGTTGSTSLVNVKEPIIASVSAPSEVCINNDDVTVTYLVNAPSGNYNIYYRVGNTSFSRMNQVGDFSETYNNLNQTTTFTIDVVEYTSAPNCSQAVNASATTTVSDLPTADLVQTIDTLCQGDQHTLVVNVTGDGVISVRYRSNRGAVGILSGPQGTLTENVLPPLGSSVYYLDSVWSQLGQASCTNTITSDSTRIFVKDNPNAAVTPNKTDVCENETVTFTVDVTGSPVAEAQGPFTLFYHVGSGPEESVTVNSGTSTFTRSFSSSTSFTVDSIRDASNPRCVTFLGQIFNFNVTPRATVAFTGNQLICQDEEAVLNLDFTGLAPFAYTINGISLVATQDTIHTVAPVSDSVFTITQFTDARGCIYDPGNQVTVTVHEKPDVLFTSPSQVCAGSNAEFSVTLNGGTPPYSIFFSGVTPPFTGTNIPDGTTTYTRQINANTTIVFDSIVDSSVPQACRFIINDARFIEAVTPPSGSVAVTDNTICQGEQLDLIFTIAGRGINTVYWSGSDGTSGSFTSPSGTIAQQVIAGTAGSITYSLDSIVDGSGIACTVYPGSSVVVDVTPTPTATLSGGGPVCEGENLNLNITLTGSGDITVNFEDNFGKTYTYTNVQGAYIVPYDVSPALGNLTFTVTSVNSNNGVTTCIGNGSSTANYNVLEAPTAAINSSSTHIVAGGSATLRFTVTGVGPFDIVYTDGTSNYTLLNVPSSGTTVTVNPNDTTTYTILSITDKGTAPALCTNTTQGNVTIMVSNADASISGNATICLGETFDAVVSFPTNGLYNIVVGDQFGNNQAFFDLTDGAIIMINPVTTGALVYTIQSVTDQSTGTTTSNTVGQARVNVVEQKTVTISGTTTVCEGSPSNLIFTFEGTGVFTVHYTNGTDNFSFSATEDNSPVIRSVPANMLDVGMNNFFITSVTNTNPTSVCPISFSGTGVVEVMPTPVVNFTFGQNPVCFGTPTQLEFNFPGPGPFDVIYITDDGTPVTDTAKGVTNGYSIPVDGTTPVRFTATQVKYSNPPTCVNNTNQTIVLSINNNPSGSIAGTQTICSGSSGNLRFLVTGVLPVTVEYTDGVNTFSFTTFSADTTIIVSPTANTDYTIARIIDSNTPNCEGVGSGTASVTVVPQPNVTFALDVDSVCEGEDAILRFNANGTPPFTINYLENGSPRTFTAFATGQNDLVVNPTVNTTYRLVSVRDGSAAGCIRNLNQSVSITVLKKPTIVMSTTTPVICEGRLARIRVVLTGEDTITVQLRNSDGTYDTTFRETAGTYFINVTPQSGTNTYTAVFISDQSDLVCSRTNAAQVTIQAVPGPTGSISTTTEVCEGGFVDLEFNIAGSGLMTVYFANDRGYRDQFVTSGGITNITVDPRPETGIIKYYIDSIVSQSGVSCPGASVDTAYAIVNPTPIGTITSLDKTICQGEQADLLISVEGNGPFLVKLNDGATDFFLDINTDSNGDGKMDKTFTIQPAQTTTVRIVEITDNSNPNCISNVVVPFTVKVNQKPTAAIAGSTVVCQGDTISLTFNLRGRAPLTLVYSDGLGNTYTIPGLLPGILVLDTVVPLGSSIYSINSITDSNAPTCTNTGSGAAIVTVRPTPTGTISLTPSEICAGQVAQLNFNLGGGQAPFTVIFSRGGDSDTIVSNTANFSINVSPADTTEYRLLRITESSPNACSAEFNNVAATLNVNPLPTATVDAEPGNICVGGSTVLTFKGKGFAPVLVRYNQNSTVMPPVVLNTDSDNDGFLDATVNVIPGVNPSGDTTIYTITAVEDGNPNVQCFGTVFDTAAVIVNPAPQASLLSASPSTICYGDSSQLSFAVSGNGSIKVVFRTLINGVEVSRDSVIGTEAQSPLAFQVAPFETSSYEIVSVSSNNTGVVCTGTGNAGSVTVIVNPKPTVSIRATENPICSGEQTDIIFEFTGTPPFDVEYVVNGDTNILNNITSGYSQPVTLTDTSVFYIYKLRDGSFPNCLNFDSIALQINVNPNATARIFKDSTYCTSQQEGFYVELAGVGNVRFVYRDQLGNVYPPVTRTAGVHFIPVNQTPGTRIYTLVSVDDQSIPKCLGNVSGSARVVVVPQPTVNFSGITDICEGEESTITIELIGGLPNDSITVFYSDEDGNTFSYSNRPGIYDVLHAPGDSSIFTPDSVIYNKIGCPGILMGTARIDVRPNPEGFITVDRDICNGQSVEVTFNLEFDGPFDIVYQLGDDTPVELADVMSGHTITFSPTQTTMVRLLSVIYSDIPLCTTLNLDSVVITVSDSLQVSQAPKVCNTTNTAYTIQFTITGGNTGSYTVNGDPVTSPYTTPPIPNGPYTFIFSDNSGCPAVVISGNDTCDCSSFSGTMANTALLEACENEVIFANHNGDHLKDANDTLVFVLTDRNDQRIGNIYGVNSTPGFIYNSQLKYDTIYYIVPVVGNADLINGFEQGDRCLSVGFGTPVRFRENTTLDVEILYNDSGAVCTGDSITVKITVVGNDEVGPYNVTFNPGFGGDVNRTFAGSVYVEKFGRVTADGAVKIKLFRDLSITTGCELIADADSSYEYTASPLPNSGFTASDLQVCEGETVTFTADVQDDDNVYLWNFDGPVGAGKITTHRFDIAGNYDVTLQVTNEFGCVSISPATLVQVQARPDAKFGTSPVAPFCAGTSINEEIVFTDITNFPQGGTVNWYINDILQPETGPAGLVMRRRFAAPGTYKVRMDYTSSFGCVDSMVTTILVEGPQATVSYSSPTPCVLDNYSFILNNKSDVQTVEWKFEGNNYLQIFTTDVFNVSFPRSAPIGDIIRLTLTLTSASGCVYDTIISVPVYETFADFDASPAKHCFGTPVTFTDLSTPVSGPNASSSWRWSFGGGGIPDFTGKNPPVTAYNAPGNYDVQLIVVGNQGCTDTVSKAVEVLPEPVLITQGDSICAGMSGTLSVYNLYDPDNSATSYGWVGNSFYTGGTSTPTASYVITAAQDTVVNFTVFGTTTDGCQGDTTVQVYFFDLIDPFSIIVNGNNPFAPIDTLIVIGEMVDVGEVRQYDLQDNRLIYTWNPVDDISCTNCPDPVISTLESREYFMTVSDIYGCRSQDVRVNIRIDEIESIALPDAFSPNGDGVNDVIYPEGHALKDVEEFKVFNRWGEMVHNGSGKNTEVGWDGRYKGKVQAPDNYTYTVVVNTYTGKRLIKKGTFALMQ